jgi:outer membrane protein TolC
MVMLIAGASATHTATVRAEEPTGLSLKMLRNGQGALPLVWQPYRPVALPPADLRNGKRLVEDLAARSLRLSQREFLQLVVENNLDLLAARYNFAIAHVDVLRARSGQAARGLPSAPLPAAVFAGAIGAGVSTVVPLSAGGTGGAAISTQGKLVSIGPRGVFDPTVNLNVSYDRLINPLNTIKVAGVSAVTVPSTVLQTRFQQELPEGTSFSVSFNLQRQASTQGGLLFNPAFTSFGSAQIYQPLLNGFGLPLTQRFVTLAENNTKIVTEAFHSLLNDTLSNAANAYWDLVALRDNRRAAEEAVTAATQQRDDDRQRAEVGVITELDALASESQLATARVQLVQAQTSVAQQEVVVKTLISKRSDPALDATTVEPTETLPGPTDVDLESIDRSIAAALASRASIRQAVLSLQNQRIAQEYTRKNLLPVFSLYAQIDVYGLSPNTPPALQQLIRLNYPEYSIGLTWSLPLFNRAAAADDARARIETRQSEVSLQRTRQQVTTQVQNATTSVTQNRARVAAAARALSASRTAYEGEQARLDVGASTAYRVLLALRDLTTAQAADVQARVNYAKAIVAYQVAVGSLLERNGIDADAALRGTLWNSAQ